MDVTENMRMHFHYTHGRDLAELGSYEDLKAEHGSLQCPPVARPGMTEKQYLAAIARGDLDRGEAAEIEHANPELARALADLRAGDVVTELVRAPSDEAAAEIIAQVRERAVLMALADLLFVEAEGHALPWIRKAVVREARS